MSSSTPEIAIAFVVREKFGWALPSLQRLYRYIDQEFTLYFVDCGYPAAVRRQIGDFFRDKNNVVEIRATRYLLPNESLNLVIDKATEKYICLVQIDVLIAPRFMDELLSTLQKRQCAIVWPMTYEIQDGKREPHRSEYTDTRIVEGKKFLQVQQVQPDDKIVTDPERQIHHVEMHCLMMTMEAARALSPFPAINTREHIDLAVNAYRQGMSVFANEKAHANYVLPPIFDYDADYFSFRWDLDVAIHSHNFVAERWNIQPFPIAMSFVRHHRRFAQQTMRQSHPETISAEDLAPPICLLAQTPFLSEFS